MTDERCLNIRPANDPVINYYAYDTSNAHIYIYTIIITIITFEGLAALSNTTAIESSLAESPDSDWNRIAAAIRIEAYGDT